MKERTEEEAQKLIERARELYQEDDIEIDSDAKFSDTGEGGAGGTWVQAWVYVPPEGEDDG